MRISNFKDLIHLFLERGREGEKQRKKHRYVRETSTGCLLHGPSWGPGPQPRHVPWPEMEPATFWLVGQYSIH